MHAEARVQNEQLDRLASDVREGDDRIRAQNQRMRRIK